MVEERVGRPGKVLILQAHGQVALRPPCLRSGRKQGRPGLGIQPSRHRRLAQERAAAGGIRRDDRRRDRRCKSVRLWDFEARGPLRANAKSAMAERRASVNRSPCGRRTSIQGSMKACSATLPLCLSHRGVDGKRWAAIKRLYGSLPPAPGPRPRCSPNPAAVAMEQNDAPSCQSALAPYPQPSFVKCIESPRTPGQPVQPPAK